VDENSPWEDASGGLCIELVPSVGEVTAQRYSCAVRSSTRQNNGIKEILLKTFGKQCLDA
jgi:hypothetical protein